MISSSIKQNEPTYCVGLSYLDTCHGSGVNGGTDGIRITRKNTA